MFLYTCFRFPDEETAKIAMAAFVQDDVWQYTSITHAIIPVGVLPDVEGWHMNFIGDVPDTALPYKVTPATPMVAMGSDMQLAL